MILALDIGNSQIHGGVFDGEELKLQFRRGTHSGTSSDEFGTFLRVVLRENGMKPEKITQIALCSVVPDVIHSIKGACKKYFDLNPFVLQAGTKTGLKIKYRNPLEVGADRIANAIAATRMFPGQNLIVVDYGTATTFCAITAERDYLGGLILPGFRISMEALESRTAKLPSVELLAPQELIGKSTVESIQSGLYFSNLYAVRGIAEHIKKQYFDGKPALVLGTGGFSRMFENEKVFDSLIPELVLLGLREALKMNA
jgi:type III pantothenate kinase